MMMLHLLVLEQKQVQQLLQALIEDDLEMQTGGVDGYGSQFKMPPMNEIKKDSLIDLNVQVADGDNNSNESNHSGDEKASKNVGKLTMTAVRDPTHSKNSTNSKGSRWSKARSSLQVALFVDQFSESAKEKNNNTTSKR